jgi:heme oxygenase
MRLRTATDAVHQALHRAAPFAAIADGTATRESYGATLRFLHRYHAAMAPVCAHGASALGQPQLAEAHAARLAALESDLAHLGLAPVAVPDEVPGDGDFCAGALYTVQGSTLGGKVIHSQLDALLPDDEGRRFFKGGPDDSRHWQSLCAALETRGTRLTQLEAGALRAFSRFREMLDS